MGAFKTESIAKTEPVCPTVIGDLQKDGLNVFCWCNRCGHNAEVALSVFVERFGLDYPVPELGQVMRCKKCKANDIATRPSWPSYGGQMARHNS